MNPLFVTRPLILDDVPFVSSAWLKHYQGSPEATDLGAAYRRTLLPIIQHWVRDGCCTVICSVDDTAQLFGCSVYSHFEAVPVLHWIYVKSGFRRMGLATALIQQMLGTSPIYALSSPPYGAAIKRLHAINQKLQVQTTTAPALRKGS